MRYLKEKISISCNNLKSVANKFLSALPLEYVKSGYKCGNEAPTEGWMPFERDGKAEGRDNHYWFRTNFRTPPEKPHTSYYVRCLTGHEGAWDATACQSLIYLNGKMMQGADTNHTEIYLEPDTEYELINYFYVGSQADKTDMHLDLMELDELSEQLYYDLRVALQTSVLLDKNEAEYTALMSALESTVNLIDFRDTESHEYKESVIKAIDHIGTELYTKLCSTDAKPIVHCIGHTHIDIEWLWARAQTREKSQRSFSTAIRLMDKYPEYRFMLSQPELYRYLKEEAPEKYEELTALIKEGRVEPEGAMWVEADCNLISGESFVRQILQGKKFFKDEFGKESKILFLPDVFGYSAAMPQILKKSGIEYFVTSKISWNDTNTMPVDRFMWEGIDGSEIYTNFITTQNYSGVGKDPSRFTTYVGTLTPTEIKGSWQRFKQKEFGNRVMTTYGFGDGGGGPTKEMLETQRRLAKGLPGMPVSCISSLEDYLKSTREEFDAAAEKLKRSPKWTGELYLEFHRGTYTSMAKNKRNNRKSEFALQKAELLSYTDLLYGGSYDAEGIYHNWNLALHDQFHDIIPGSSIKEVYDGTDEDYREIFEFTDELAKEKLGNIAKLINTDGGILVYNSTGMPQKGAVSFEGETFELYEEIPAFGWKVVKDLRREPEVKIDGLNLENKYYRLSFDKCGRIISLYDKESGREVFKKGELGNEFQMFEDYPRQYDNWEITEYYKSKKWVLDSEAEIIPVSDGSRKGFKISRSYMHSGISQNIWLYSDSRRIDFETEVDWREHHQIFKIAFPFDIHANTAKYEIQFGHLDRPISQNTDWEQAKYECCGHKWVDISEYGYGVALLNDCKYGHSTEGSTLKLTVLKCGTYPNAEADIGIHKFTYSLLPHKGDILEGEVIREAYLLNQPLSAQSIGTSQGTLPECYSLAQVSGERIVAETVKKSENGDDMILRMYEAYNSRENFTVKVPEGFKKAYLCDLMENETKELEFKNNEVKLEASNFEIISLKFKK